ncbi:MAG: class B sortase [Lachnospiraceae bacterium]|nr:class B sortase [Lachnospiraceae bacterium]
MKSRIIIFSAFAVVILAAAILASCYMKTQDTGAVTDETQISQESADLSDSIGADTDVITEDLTDNVSETDVHEPSQDDPEISAESDEAAVSADEQESVQEETRVPLDKYTGLLEINPYISGWLTIDGLSLSEPVVYTPKSQNYFLHRSLDGSYMERGSLFIAVNWQEYFGNTLIYGHNMKDGSSFGLLQKYADESFGRANPYMWFDTLYEENEYELVAAFYSQIDEEELETTDDRDEKDKMLMAQGLKNRQKKQEEEISAETMKPENEAEPTPEITPVTEADVTLADLDLFEDMGDADIYRQEKDEDNGRFRYYYYNDLSDKADFDYFAQNIKERALYDTGVDISYGDELLTLSTCSYQVKNGRFVVVAKKIK